MDRLRVLQRHLSPWKPKKSSCKKVSFVTTSTDHDGSSHTAGGSVVDKGWTVEVEGPAVNSGHSQKAVLTTSAVQFVTELVRNFTEDLDKILRERLLRKLELQENDIFPNFLSETKHIRNGDWKVNPVPQRLRCRHVDLGDVSPSNIDHLVSALNSSAQGIQVDFDDGHCPSWGNQIRGLYNVNQVVAGLMPSVPPLQKAPVLMLRPRAWNMIEHHMLVDGREIPGPLFDFGLLMYHNAKLLFDQDCGPFFYLPKLENHKEARLWNEIFTWTEKKLHLPSGSIKACVLIENILASFEMDEILYELREHSAGLNCGIWDYSASFVNKFGQNPDFVLPDRNKYVSMERHFLKSYRELLIQTCHRRHCRATGGMAAQILPVDRKDGSTLQNVIRSKEQEIMAGVDGFMVYDVSLVQPMQQLFERLAPGMDQLDNMRTDVCITATDLLKVPGGSVTMNGLRHNIMVGVLFIEAWFRGQGHFVLKGAVEDSATAEISRSQVWQWIRHRAKIEESGEIITSLLIKSLAKEVEKELISSSSPFPVFVTKEDRYRLNAATDMFLEIITMRDFPEFITTYLYLDHTFRSYHNKWMY